MNVSSAIALQESLKTVLNGREMPIDVRPRVLFNPDTRSANFFIPGLLVIMCQIMATMLAATAIVREKENGTLEQLFMTPVKAPELILGKLLPYLVLTFFEFCAILLFMNVVFQVPRHRRTSDVRFSLDVAKGDAHGYTDTTKIRFDWKLPA